MVGKRMGWARAAWLGLLGLATIVGACPASAHEPAEVQEATPQSAQVTDILAARRTLYEQMSALTAVPWVHLAAIDQYERTLSKAMPNKRPQQGELLGIYIPPEQWAGPLNPDWEDNSPMSIAFFNGLGIDGDGDGKADLHSDVDRLYAIARLLSQYGTSEDDLAIGLWTYYSNPRAVQRITQFAALYSAFDTLSLNKHAFPLPVGSNYSYRSTWGTKRSYGGRRTHEGTDIFAHHGLPVRSTCYGVVEVKGWNRYGGWRIGIRDIDNVYHYFAHLSGFEKKLQVGDIVEPGQTIGWVGSSGYGKPGTQGKFPPHLHYGLYRDRGLIEWAFDPYPSLHYWEQEERKSKHK